MRYSTLFTIAAGIAPFAAADCCRSVGIHGRWYCLDGTETGLFSCCGNGPCNIFCCNCDGGCIKKRPGLMANAEMMADHHTAIAAADAVQFAQADVGAKGYLTLADLAHYMGVDDGAGWAEWFNMHDTNGDGVITLDEFRLGY